MGDLILRQEDIDRFSAILEDLNRKTKVALTVLVHRDGHLLASAGETEAVDTTALSALVSANFSSTVAIANLLGEKEFTTQHHAGRERCILVSLVDEYSFLVAVFDLSVPLGPIQQYTQECRQQLVEALEKLYRNEPERPLTTDTEEAARAAASIVDAEEALRQAKARGESLAQAVPRRLSYTSRPPREREMTQEVPEDRPQRPRVIREPDADDADLEALANAITSRSERESKKASSTTAPASGEVVVIDGKPMSVISLKNKKPPQKS